MRIATHLLRAKQGRQENTTGGRNRTEATSLLEKSTCVGIASGVFGEQQSEEVRRENVLASAGGRKGTWFRHAVTEIQERGACSDPEDCTALTSGTCLIQRTTSRYSSSIRIMTCPYVSDSLPFPILPPRQPGHGRPLRPQKAPHTCTILQANTL